MTERQQTALITYVNSFTEILINRFQQKLCLLENNLMDIFSIPLIKNPNDSKLFQIGNKINELSFSQTYFTAVSNVVKNLNTGISLKTKYAKVTFVPIQNVFVFF